MYMNLGVILTSTAVGQVVDSETRNKDLVSALDVFRTHGFMTVVYRHTEYRDMITRLG
jgi:hypothetical protein